MLFIIINDVIYRIFLLDLNFFYRNAFIIFNYENELLLEKKIICFE